MNDCPNAEIRDRLPDLLHEHLDAGARAQVMAHVERCADCRAELALLREARSLLATAPLVDVGRIVRALPSPAAARLARVSTRSRRLDWRVAASIAALALGGVSIGTYATIGKGVHEATVAPIAGAPRLPLVDSGALPPHVQTTVAMAAGSTAFGTTAGARAAVTELATGDGLNDMSASDLQTLLSDIEHMQPVPAAEPDSVVVTGPDVGTSEDN